MANSRQLAVIMFTDIVGYTSLMGKNESRAFEILELNRSIQKPIISSLNGNFIKELGDGTLSSFTTVSDAVSAALQIQQASRNSKIFQLRIGIHLGEVVFENKDVFGDGVNIAARIQAAASPGSIFVSESVYANISNKSGIGSRFVKLELLKNVKEPVKMFEIFTADPGTVNDSVEPATMSGYSKKSIAVLPFVNMSNDPGQDYFSDGMAEEILNSLTHINDLKVVSRSSSFQFKNKTPDLREVGSKLGVSVVLEGSVRKQGNRLRINAQLIDISDGFQIWSERYDRDMEDIFAIQDEIAVSITEQLKLKLLGNDLQKLTKTYTKNTAAYNFYLQGRYYWNKRNETSLKTSVEYFQKAIDLDDSYALAWSGMGDAYNLLSEYGNLRREEVYNKAKFAVEKALTLDDQLAEAHISLASLLMLDEWDWNQSAAEFRIAMALNPNYATAHHWLAESLLYHGRFEEALKAISRAMELDPVSVSMYKDKGLIYYYSTQYDLAIEAIRESQKLDAQFAPAFRLLSLCYLAKGMIAEAIRENELWGKQTKNKYMEDLGLAYIHAISGNTAEARKLIALHKDADNKFSKDHRVFALVYIALNEFENAFKYLELTCAKHEVSMVALKIDPKLDPVRHDPRFGVLLEKVGLNQIS